MMGMWNKMDTILGGTEAMRAAGMQYMTKHAGEEQPRYDERLNSALLWNQTELTLGGWVGRPFRTPLTLNDDVPSEIKDLEKNIDKQGTNMDTFTRKWFRQGIAKAFCHILIEQPTLMQRTDGAPPTIADLANQDIRPYWILIEPDQVIAARQMTIDGKETLTHLRIHELTQEQDPDDEFNEIQVERIRVYDLLAIDDKENTGVFVTVYRRDEQHPSDESAGWPIETPRFPIDIDRIPLVTFYADRQGFLLGKSPLQDLCDLNVGHWNEQSDQDSILRIARFPILAASGIPSLDNNDPTSPDVRGRDFNAEGGAVIGPYRILASEDPQSKFYYVEHSGAAIAAGRESLKELQGKMAAYGSEFLKKSPDRETATARALDSAESVSPLQAVTLSFIDACQSALALTAQWLGQEDGGTVTLITDFGPEEASGIDISALSQARQARDISQQNYLIELKRRGILADDFDISNNKTELEEEALDLSAAQPPAATIDLDGQQAPPEGPPNVPTKE